MPAVVCERCGSARTSGNVPWCGECLTLLPAARDEYRRDYQRAYQRARRENYGPSRARWIVDLDGRSVRVSLRRYDGIVVLTGPREALDAAVRLARDALGVTWEGKRISRSGGGRGTWDQSRFRISAPLGTSGEAGLREALARVGAVEVGRFEDDQAG